MMNPSPKIEARCKSMQRAPWRFDSTPNKLPRLLLRRNPWQKSLALSCFAGVISLYPLTKFSIMNMVKCPLVSVDVLEFSHEKRNITAIIMTENTAKTILTYLKILLKSFSPFSYQIIIQLFGAFLKQYFGHLLQDAG